MPLVLPEYLADKSHELGEKELVRGWVSGTERMERYFVPESPVERPPHVAPKSRCRTLTLQVHGLNLLPVVVWQLVNDEEPAPDDLVCTINTSISVSEKTFDRLGR
jgi:hypothetical protein